MDNGFVKHKCFILPFILSGVFFLSLVILPAVSAGNNNTDEGFIGITGLVINDTISKAGNDLFDAFNSRWKPIEGLNFTITIIEKPDQVFGSQFWIKVDEDVVYSGRLNPRWDFIDKTAKTAVQKVSLFLLERLTVNKELEMY